MARLAGLGLYYRFTTTRGRIVALNMVGLLIMGVGLLYLTDTRDALIEARIKSFEVEADIISRSLASNSTDAIDAAATTSNDPISSIPIEMNTEEFPAQPFQIRPDAAARLLRLLIDPAKTHGFIFDRDGTPIVDSNKIYKPGQLLRVQQASRPAEPESSAIYRLWLKVESFLRAESLPE